MPDLYHAARALQSVPHEARKQLCATLLWRAHVADKYVKRLQKLHPEWGDGSLRAVALQDFRAGKKKVSDPDLWGCMAIILDALKVTGRYGY